jgi:membrane protein implicated in regulation of membrane protease activity
VTLARNVVVNADSHAGAELAALAALAAAGAMRHPRHAGFALIALALLVAELAAGQIGWRYEVWALMAIGMMALSAWAPFDTVTAHPAVVAAAALCAALVSVPYLQNLALTPRAAHNIFSQQAQMGRAVERLGTRSVAVNDIGLVGWMNPGVYVVDLVGLASSEALEHRRAGIDDPAWMDQQATRHGVDLVMIYPAWFSRVPATWVKVAELRLAGRPITTGSDLVAFYVPDAGRAAATMSALHAFARELPTGASLSVF